MQRKPVESDDLDIAKIERAEHTFQRALIDPALVA